MEDLVLRVQRGETALIPMLWERIEKLVYWHAKRFYALLSAPQCDLDDLKQSGYFGLVKAVEHFDPEAGARFSTFLLHWLRHEFQEVAGLRRPRDAMMHICKSLDDPLTEEDDTVIADLIKDPAAMNAFDNAERRIFNEQLHKALEGVLQQIDQDDAQLIRKRYFEGLKASEIGEERKVLNMEYKALRKCRRVKQSKELHQFLDEATPSHVGGLRPTETTVLMREDIVRSGFSPKWL